MKRKTTITLTIAGLLGLAGALYGASFFSLDLDPQGAGPLGVAASQTDLYTSDYCTATGVPFRNIKKIDCDGVATVVTAIPTVPGCQEMYMAIAPSVSAIRGFTPRDVFITNGILIYRFTPPTPPNPLTAADIFATIPDGGCSPDHTGITFDHVGTSGFGNDMIVTCANGDVWKIDNLAGGPHIIPVGAVGHEMESPAVVPATFGPHGGELWGADDSFFGNSPPGAVHAISSTGVVTLNIVPWVGAEGVHVIPEAPCTFCNTLPAPGVFFQAITLFAFPNGVYQYPFPPVPAAGVLIPSEANGGTGLVTVSGSTYSTVVFDGSMPGAIFEGASFVDCDVPTPTPTSTPTATSTPTSTSTPTATATSTPTATATSTPTATATSTPTPTPTPQGTGCTESTSISSNFNGTPINAGNYIWFTSVLKAHGLPTNQVVTIHFTNQSITSSAFTLSPGDATVIFDPSATMATTTFVGGMPTTTVPSGINGNTFFSALSYLVPANIPGGLNPVTWSGTISSDTPGVSINWQWAAAVYTSFSSNYNALGVKPVDDKNASIYKNSDHAGTPENFKQFVIGGARGGGASNYTGSYSGTGSVCRNSPGF